MLKICFSWDDGAIEDLKLIELHYKYDLPAIFFTPTYNSEGREVLTSKQIMASSSELISFGGHTQNHVYLTDIPIKKVENEIYENQIYLEDILGRKVDHFCLPGGKYNTSILNIAFKYYKTVRTADTMNFKNATNLIHPTIHFYPRTYKSHVGNSIRNHAYKEAIYIMFHPHYNFLDLTKKLLTIDKEDDKTIIIWGHSWEIDEMGLWDEIEELLLYIANNYKDCVIKYSNLLPVSV